MSEKVFPQRCANDITVILRTVFGADRFPVNVREVVREISSQKFPSDPLTMIRGGDLPGFEGALVPAPAGKKGWGILYNNTQTSGRINFTIGHEFGHYLLHRLQYPNGFQCSTEDLASWDSEYGMLEQQANEFAATLLMPLDDFRAQIDARQNPDLDFLGSCADRYDVSLIAATLRWLQYTSRRSVLVVARDGFVLWARSSKSALKSGMYFKTRGRAPIALPEGSLAAQRSQINHRSHSKEHNDQVWFKEPCLEHVLFSDQYDFTISLVHFGNAELRAQIDNESEEEDVAQRMTWTNSASS